MLVDWEAIHRSKLVRKMNAINFDFDHNQHKCVSSFMKPKIIISCILYACPFFCMCVLTGLRT